jgi:hypothetical protein
MKPEEFIDYLERRAVEVREKHKNSISLGDVDRVLAWDEVKTSIRVYKEQYRD